MATLDQQIPCDEPIDPPAPYACDSALDQRQTHRFPAYSTAQLHCKRRRYQVRMIDTSAEGCAFVLHDDPPLSPGDQAELRTLLATYQIEVISKVALEGNARVVHRGRFRIGAKYLAEITLDDDSLKCTSGLTYWLQRAWSPGNGGSSASFLYFVLATLLGVAVWVALRSRSTPEESESQPGWLLNALLAPGEALPPIKPLGNAQNSMLWPWLAVNPPGASKKAASGGPTLAKRGAAIVKSMSDVAAQWKLDGKQEMAVRRIGKITDAAIAALAARSDAAPEEIAARRERLLEAARQEVWRLLTPEQQAAWEQAR